MSWVCVSKGYVSKGCESEGCVPGGRGGVSRVVVLSGCVSERVSVPGVACPGVMSEGMCVMSEGLCVQRACV